VIELGIGDYVDAVEAGKLLGISSSAVHQMARRGTLPSSWWGGKRVWLRSAVLALAKDAEYRKRSRRDANRGVA
jgi:predicted DNA-binding transcriptional regulator AlpA